MKSIASHVLLRAALAALVPLAVVAALAWPRGATVDVPPSRAIERSQPRALDTAPVKQAALDLAASVAAARAPTTSAPAAPSASTSASGFDGLDQDAGRIRALGALTERIYAARDVRRKEGKSGAELRKAFSLEELGGAQLVKDLALDKGARLLVLRDGTVLGPSGAALPPGIRFAAEPKAHASVAEASVDGAAVRAVRYCPYGEVTCLVDVARADAPAPSVAAPAAAEHAAPSTLDTAKLDTAKLDTAKLDAALAALAAAGVAPSEGGAATTSSARSLVPFAVALALALACAVALLVWVAGAANAIAQRATSVIARLQQAAAGRAPDAPSADAPGADLRELHALHDAVTQAARGLAEQAERAAREQTRRARVDALAQAIAGAATAHDLSVRVRVDDVDDAGLIALVDASNRLLESLDHTVLRWQSHAQATGSRAENARALEARAEALKPLAPLLSDTAQRVLRLANVEGAPPRLAEELRALGEALGQRGKTAQALMDALLLDLATERPQGRNDDALALLRKELSDFKTSESAPERVAALKDLPPSEIGERVAAERA